LRQKWDVQSGQMWQLGEHRIICGDCTDRAVVERVMGGEKADLMFTDPPYNVDVAGGSHDPRDEKNYRSGNVIDNDKLSSDEFYKFLQSTVNASLHALKEGASMYMCFSDSEIANFVNAFCCSDVYYSQMIIWVKQQMVFGRKDYHSKHEPILYGWKSGAGHFFTEDRTQVSVWEIDRPMRSEKEHPTQKPLELYEKAFKNSSRINSIIYEPFSGSGTAIIACENLSRKARAIEISPAYVAVAIQRWVDVTGKEPILLDA
jgi:DNA modification methylase